ncbi:MAG: SAM-dependent methyltransferase [Anaerolineaceae bacterium]
MTRGILFIVATPIGHPHDITLRALDTLRTVDAVVCEEARPGSTLLKKFDIQKPLVLLNEHNEKLAIPDIVARLNGGENLALISDCGTPVFADPGFGLLNALEECGIKVIPIPGPASLMAAISVCSYDLSQFVYGGFLPRESQERRRALVTLQATRLPIILMDAPYRLKQLLEDTVSVFGNAQPVMLGCDLTLPGEKIIHGTLRSVIDQTIGKKCEFVLIVAGHDPAGQRQRLCTPRSGKRRQ